MNSSYNFAFAIEQQLGHITFGENLQQSIENDLTVEATWIPISLDEQDLWQVIPNLSLRLSLRTRGLAGRALKKKRINCFLFHTQLITLFSIRMMRRVPSLISLDATPENFKTIADAYNASPPQGKLAQLKQSWYRKIFKHAAGCIAWSTWVKDSLEKDYGVPNSRIHVIPPGINLDQWQFVNRESRDHTSLRLLFVGGDFERKGGNVLLTAFRQGLAKSCQLDIVTTDQRIQAEESVRVHYGLKPNSPALKQLFMDADVFVLPTLGDGQPWVLLEAMASGLPIVTTAIGAIPEMVDHGVTGFLVPLQDPGGIIQAIQSLIDHPDQRIAMGMAGRAVVEQRFDASINAQRLLDVMKHYATTKNSIKQ